MNAPLREHYETWVRALETFGHRGSATDHEKRAADYLVDELAALEIEATLEPFRGHRSAGLRVLIHIVLAAVGALLLWSAPWLTIILGLVALISLAVDFSTLRPGLSRLLPAPPSQNVVARIPAASGQPKRRIVVLGHYDTQRTGWIWNEALVKWLAPRLRNSPGPMKSPLFLVLVALVLQPLAGLLAVAGVAGGLASALGVAALVIYGISGVLIGQWAFGPFVPGASDNATGAAAVLAIGEAWRADPQDDVELVLLQPGCEEVGLLGASAWADQHRAEIAALPTTFLNIDSLGYGRPRFLSVEYSMVGFPARYPQDLVDLASKEADELGLIDAGPHPLPVPTDGLALLMRGLPGLSVLSFDDTGHMPNYHQMSDTSANMDFDVAWQGVVFSWALVKRIAGAG